MEFIKLTGLAGGTVYINVASVTAFCRDESRGATVIDTGDEDTYVVQESAEYIAQHVYVCNKTYVNSSKGG